MYSMYVHATWLLYNYLVIDIIIDFIVVPSEPRSLVVFSVNSSSVTLQWMPPESPNGVIMQYSILHDASNITNFGNNMLMDTIEGLSPDTVYDVQLRAHTVVGAGPSTSLTFLTCKLLNIISYSYQRTLPRDNIGQRKNIGKLSCLNYFERELWQVISK